MSHQFGVHDIATLGSQGININDQELLEVAEVRITHHWHIISLVSKLALSLPSLTILTGGFGAREARSCLDRAKSIPAGQQPKHSRTCQYPQRKRLDE